MKHCSVCKRTGGRIISSGGLKYCSRCYSRRNKVKHPLPAFAEITKDDNGNPICHECGEAHRKLMSHVWQCHDLSALEYKIIHGLDKYKSIMNDEAVELARERTLAHPELIRNNLIDKGKGTRYVNNHAGRTKDKLSEQSKRRLHIQGKNMMGGDINEYKFKDNTGNTENS